MHWVEILSAINEILRSTCLRDIPAARVASVVSSEMATLFENVDVGGLVLKRVYAI